MLLYLNRVRKVILPLPLVFWKQGLGLKGYRNYHCPTSTIHCSYNQTLHTYQSTVVYACNLNMLPLATQWNCLKNTTKTTLKNQPTDRPKTHQWDTRKNKQKSMNVEGTCTTEAVMTGKGRKSKRCTTNMYEIPWNSKEQIQSKSPPNW